MFMSNSQRSGLISFLLAVLASMSVVADAVSAQTLPPHRQEPTSEEISEAVKVLASIFYQRDDMPEGQPILNKRGSYFRWNSAQAGKQMLVVAKINFPGSVNSYCRLVTLSPDLKKSTLISLPPQANYDDCARATRPIYADLNADQVDDVAYEVEIASNRYPQNVTVPMIYLSNGNAAGGYCYAAKLSGNVQPKDLSNVKALLSQAQKEVERLGSGILKCEIP